MISRGERIRTSTNEFTRKHRPDYGLFVISTILLAIGLIIMYAISPALAGQGGDVGENYFVIRQFIAVGIGLVAFYVCSLLPLHSLRKFNKLLVVTAIIVSLVGIVVGGQGSRWIQFGAFSFQTVEMVKLIVVITLSSFLAERIQNGGMTVLHDWKYPIIVASLLSLIIIVLQKDLGSAVVLFAMVLAMLYMAGFPMGKILLGIVIVIAVAGIAIVSTPYRRDRVVTFLNPASDCTNEGYHSCQALIAVGSGGVMGVGLGKSIQAYGYLPEAENDSIFAIYAEKFGFVGSVGLLLLYGSLLLRILRIAQRAPSQHLQLLTIGVFMWLMSQGIINIAAMLGLIPLKGITLPFISYGGTSLIFSMAALGLVFHVSRYTHMRRVAFENNSSMKGAENEDSRYGRRDSRPRYTVTRRSS